MTAPVLDIRAGVTEITEPGLYEMDDDTYHGDPVPFTSLSQSGAKLLLEPSCPAIFDWTRQHGQKAKKEFDEGHAAHAKVLGVGAELVVIPFDAWTTKDAKAAVAEVRARGAIPLKQAQMDMVDGMAASLQQHPIASVLFEPGSGVPEVAAFWTDPTTGVWCRAKYDWLPHPVDGRLIIPDLKTSTTANPRVWAKKAAGFGYDVQDAFYREAAQQVGIADADALFLFVVIDKNPPYPVTVCQLEAVDRIQGQSKMRRAQRIFAECTAAGVWPAYSDDVETVSFTEWHRRQNELV